MTATVRTVCHLVICVTLSVMGSVVGAADRAAGPIMPVPDISGAPEPGIELPTYVLDIDLDPQRRLVRVHQQVQWTNPGTVPATELVFQVIPNNRPSPEVIELGRRTLESLRIDPRDALDERGRRLFFIGSVAEIAL